MACAEEGRQASSQSEARDRVMQCQGDCDRGLWRRSRPGKEDEVVTGDPRVLETSEPLSEMSPGSVRPQPCTQSGLET